MTMLSIEESDSVAVSGSRTVASSSGAYAELTHAPQGESLRVFSTGQQLLFEYDPASGKTRVYIPSGDLEFVAARGDIIFTSARAISLRAHTVHVASLATVRLAVTDVFGRIRSALTLQSQRATLSCPELAVTARRGELRVGELTCTADSVSGRLGQVKLVIARLERVADTVIEKANNVYTTVGGLIQVKAGRMRALLAGWSHFKAKKAFMKAEEDFKVNADKIHLG